MSATAEKPAIGFIGLGDQELPTATALTLLNSMVTLNHVDHLARIEALDMQLFDTAMTESGVNADFATAHGLAGASGRAIR